MKSILRFLCVVVMLQVSTPFMHGMDSEDKEGDERTAILEDNRDVERSISDGDDYDEGSINPAWHPSCWQRIKQSPKKIGAALLGLLIVGGWGALYAIGKSECDAISDSNLFSGLSSSHNSCPSVRWNGYSIPCQEEKDKRKLILRRAILECQKRIIHNQSGNDLVWVPVCIGDPENDFISVASGEGKRLWGDLKCRANFYDIFEADFCEEGQAAKLASDVYWPFLVDPSLKPCQFDVKNGSGIAYASWLGSNKPDYFIVEEVLDRPEYMEKECEDLAAKAREEAKCTGPFASNENSKNQKKKTPPKHKTRKRWKQ